MLLVAFPVLQPESVSESRQSEGLREKAFCLATCPWLKLIKEVPRGQECLADLTGTKRNDSLYSGWST